MVLKQTKPIDFYTWETPNGIKVGIFLEEAALTYQTHWINILKDEQFGPAFLAVSPNNKIPAIIDHDGPNGEPISIFESGAILLYLARKTGMFLPKDERGLSLVEQWLMWQMGGFGPMCGQAHHFRLYAPEKIAYGIERYSTEVQRLYGVLNKQLEGEAYIAGDYSIADMAIWPWVSRHEGQGVELSKFPAVHSWFERLAKRPAVAAAYKATH